MHRLDISPLALEKRVLRLRSGDLFKLTQMIPSLEKQKLESPITLFTSLFIYLFQALVSALKKKMAQERHCVFGSLWVSK